MVSRSQRLLRLPALVFLAITFACEQLASIQDLALTDGGPDATTGLPPPPDATATERPETGGEHEPADSGAPDIGASKADAAKADAGPTDATSDVDAANAVDTGVDVDAGKTVDAAEAGITYAQIVLSDAPLAYWRLSETSGSLAIDATGNLNDAAYVGGITYGAPGAILGDPDTAVVLDGTNGHLDASAQFPFEGNTPFTLEAWAAPQALTVSYSRIFGREVPTAPRSGYVLFVRSGNSDPATYGFERWLDGGQSWCPSTTTVTSGWHHFVATYDGSTSRIYLDGALLAAQPATAPLPSTPGPFLVGASAWDPAAYFKGSIDEIAVYGSALSGARIAAHYHASGR